MARFRQCIDLCEKNCRHHPAHTFGGGWLSPCALVAGFKVLFPKRYSGVIPDQFNFVLAEIKQFPRPHQQVGQTSKKYTSSIQWAKEKGFQTPVSEQPGSLIEGCILVTSPATLQTTMARSYLEADRAPVCLADFGA